MALAYDISEDVQEAVRALCLGRVLLKSDMSSGETTVPVKKTIFSSDIIPGDGLFRRNTTTAKLVQPAAADTPTGIEHQESVTIDTGTWTKGSAHLTGNIEVTSAVSNSYTTARGAYIRLETLPSVCSGLSFIQNDFIESHNFGPADEWFPGVIVSRMRTKMNSHSNQTIEFEWQFRIYYCDKLQDDRDNSQVIMDNAEQLMSLLYEDNFLGGTVEESDVTQVLPWHKTRINQMGRQFITPHGDEIGWAQIDMFAKRRILWDKSVIIS